MGTVISFPKQRKDKDIGYRDEDIDYSGLELFVESCLKLLNTLPTETGPAARQEFNRMVEELLQFMDLCQERRRSK